jgi:hypothetical protein
MRLLLVPLLIVLAGVPSSGDDSRPRLGRRPNITISSVLLDARNPTRRELDALTYLGGLKLTSKDHAFGGFSAMHVVGDRFTLVSDAGNVVTFRMGTAFRPYGIRFGDLPDGPGYGWAKGSRDAESLTGDPVTGKLWIGFENANMIFRYDAGLTRAEAYSQPEPMRKWDTNGGAEGLVRLAGGAFIVLSETSRLPGVEGRAALWFNGDPTAPGASGFAFAYRPPAGGFAPSDLAALPDGRLLVLVRRISINRWFESKLVLIDPRAIRPGKSIAGKEIAAFTMPVTRDNFEALAVVREGRHTVLWIASDDNRQPVQQTLLMKFRLDLPAAP